MSNSVFGYPGNKSSLADWIIEYFPSHRVYVEVFGGAAGVLANKPESYNEIYNDIDGDLVQFFDVLREKPDELVEWLKLTPYSREKYREWIQPWYTEEWRPDDPVKRAGVFFYHRCTGFGGVYSKDPGFSTSVSRNQAQTYRNQIDRLEGFAIRFRDVVVENLDWRDCLEEYDSEDTLFYLDPPYCETGCRYQYGSDFDLSELASFLRDIEGDWICSYGSVPRELENQAVRIVDRSVKYKMAAGYNGEPDSSTENLTMNYDIQERKSFDNQKQLDQFRKSSPKANSS